MLKKIDTTRVIELNVRFFQKPYSASVMGGRSSCVASIDGIKVKSPIAECVMKHCSSSCMREAEEDIEKVVAPEARKNAEAVQKAADTALEAGKQKTEENDGIKTN